jgi:adenylosuccinate synthase
LINHVLGISKAYATRVGLGPFPTELQDEMGEYLRDKGREFGATTGRPRRCGWLDIPCLRLAARLSGMDALALTKLDVLDGLDAVKICVGYRVGQAVLDEMPLDPNVLASAEPVYESCPGWNQESPEAAGRYAARISELVGLPVTLTSFGPGRDETKVESDPFEVCKKSQN